MKPWGFGNQYRGTKRHHARCPHQLASSRREQKARGVGKAMRCHTLEQCPRVVRDCISDLAGRAVIEKDDPSYIARQISFVLRTVGVKNKHLGRYVAELHLTIFPVQAKDSRVAFRFLIDDLSVRANLKAEELIPTTV